MHSPSLFTPRLLISPHPGRAILRKELASTSKEVEACFTFLISYFLKALAHNHKELLDSPH